MYGPPTECKLLRRCCGVGFGPGFPAISAGHAAGALTMPGRQALDLQISAVLGVSSPRHVAALLGPGAGPLRRLGLSALDEDEIEGFCTILRSFECGELESLAIDNFCRDDPSVDHFLPILAALPRTCRSLDVRHVLPLTRAFASVPVGIRSLGTVVLMAEIFYHSRVVGMSFSHFVTHFPALPHISELRLLMGPGHYEEPTWPQGTVGGEVVAAALLEKFPGLTSLVVEALVESLTAPPLLDVAFSFRARGVEFSICELRAASRRVSPESLRSITAGLSAAHILQHPGFPRALQAGSS
mmetsp:Transcript_160759/g.515933  ORF Transcript_160759/g.515933 Transcript_160759/m.515933 type:complete len:299 (+) Transcript_160759:268-1164(+)